MSQGFNIQHLFPTPVWSKKLTDVDLTKISMFIDTLKDTIPSRVISNVGGWQSDDILNWDTDFLNLMNIINQSAKHFANYIGVDDVFFSNVWININHQHHSNSMHDHKGSIISGVFYISVPEGDAGDLLFHRDDNSRFFLPVTTKWNDMSSTIMTLPPEEKLFVLFPGWITHSVGINNTERPRISISFNFSAEPTPMSKIFDNEMN